MCEGDAGGFPASMVLQKREKTFQIIFLLGLLRCDAGRNAARHGVDAGASGE